MAAYTNPPEQYFDDITGRSPRSFRQQHSVRQATRPFDGYASMHNQVFRSDAGLPSLRFENVRDNYTASMANAALGNPHFPFDVSAAQTWNSNGPPMPSLTNGANGLPPIGTFGGNRSFKPTRGRVGLPNVCLPRSGVLTSITDALQTWYDQTQPMPQAFGGFETPRQLGNQPRPESLPEADDELIPTAIVIKNIPFAVKKEQLVEMMTEMNLPLPYAFNYHFDNGVFRGLAFANFTSPDETAMVIRALNHYDLNGRKLRVEYKKMLPLAERERIEREKRERRGQLEEQHQPVSRSQLHAQPSSSSISRNTPSPLSHRSSKPGKKPVRLLSQPPWANWSDLDMNDPKTLDFYTTLQLFRNDPNREVLIFPPTLEPHDRRVVHTLAHQLGLMHTSRGNGDQRQVHIYRAAPGANVSPPNPSMSGAFQPNDPLRRNLNKSATTDFNESRHFDSGAYTLRGQSSVGLLDVGDSNAFRREADANLRNAKSFADLRSWNPSPAPSSASFPAELQTNGARLQALNEATNASTPMQTPTVGGSGLGLARDENFLISGVSNVSIGGGPSTQTSPRRQRGGLFGWDDPQPYQATAPIGSHRAVSMGGDLARNQPRGGASERGQSYRRQNGRGSDELRSGPPVIAE